jgi:hypothetical protein
MNKAGRKIGHLEKWAYFTCPALLPSKIYTEYSG